MKLKHLSPTLLLICAFLAPVTLFAQSGKVLESLSFDSRILGTVVNYSIYLPPGYKTSVRNYPAVYLLHGYSGRETDWIQYGEMQLTVDEVISDQKIPPMIIVMPDAGNSFYVNSAAADFRYEDMFFKELIPLMESTYRIRTAKEFRAIAGLSMGGYGALIYAMKHPDLFTACAPLSAAIFRDEEALAMTGERWDQFFGDPFGAGLQGQDRLTEHWKSNSPFHLAKATEAEQLRSVRYYFDCGDDDFLFLGNAMFHLLLNDLEIPHEFRVRDGEHSWDYWRSGLVEALKFIGEGFRR